MSCPRCPSQHSVLQPRISFAVLSTIVENAALFSILNSDIEGIAIAASIPIMTMSSQQGKPFCSLKFLTALNILTSFSLTDIKRETISKLRPFSITSFYIRWFEI
jgi:hypothetical protein